MALVDRLSESGAWRKFFFSLLSFFPLSRSGSLMFGKSTLYW